MLLGVSSIMFWLVITTNRLNLFTECIYLIFSYYLFYLFYFKCLICIYSPYIYSFTLVLFILKYENQIQTINHFNIYCIKLIYIDFKTNIGLSHICLVKLWKVIDFINKDTFKWDVKFEEKKYQKILFLYVFFLNEHNIQLSCMNSQVWKY